MNEEGASERVEGKGLRPPWCLSLPQEWDQGARCGGLRRSLGGLPREVECGADSGGYSYSFLQSAFHDVAGLFPSREEHQLLKIKWTLWPAHTPDVFLMNMS